MLACIHFLRLMVAYFLIIKRLDVIFNNKALIDDGFYYF